MLPIIPDGSARRAVVQSDVAWTATAGEQIGRPSSPPVAPGPPSVAASGTPRQAPAAPAAPSLPEVGGQAWLDGLPLGQHGELVSALVGFYRSAEAIANGFADFTSRGLCLRIGRDELMPRLERFAEWRDAPEQDIYTAWVEPDLLPILNGVSELYSRAIRECRGGNASARQTVAWLHHLLYRDLSMGCSDGGWFDVQLVVPYETDFDPVLHHAIGTEEATDSSQKIVDVRRVGRLEHPGGAVVAPAHVVVGR